LLHHGDGNWNYLQRVLQGPRGLSDALFLVNIFAYISLNLCTLVRIYLFPRKVWADLVDPQRVFSFFTIIAGSDVLGMGLDLRDFGVGTAMFWAFALFLWLALIYCGFGVLIFLSTSRDVDIAHGGWLIAIVATQSLAILGAAVAMNFPAIGPGAVILAYMLWGLGLILYSIFIVQFTGRVFFFEMAPSDVTPVLWVVMGAAAIGANAGSELVRASVNLPLLQLIRPFVEGVTLITWAWATWSVPLLLALGIWKHVIRRAPVRYTPLFWSLVFPIGMYAVATLRLSLVSDFPPLRSLSETALWFALAAWTVTAVASLNAGRQRFRGAATRRGQTARGVGGRVDRVGARSKGKTEAWTSCSSATLVRLFSKNSRAHYCSCPASRPRH